MRERDRRKVREVLEQLLAELRAHGVVALEWRTGEDWAGDPVRVPVAGAETFVLLQEKRHSADYDLSASFSRREVEDLLERVTEALDRWRGLKGREPVLAGLFLLALRFGERVRR